jgi:phospholipase C
VPPPLSGDADPEFGNYGFRVPALVAGPYVKQGCAIDTVFDHVSVLRTLMTRWGVGALNARMAMANDLSSCIDPAYVMSADPQPPVLLPMLDVSIGALRAHFDAVARGLVEPQHPELIASLRSQGIYRSVMRGVDHHATLKLHLEDAVRKGIARIVG